MIEEDKTEEPARDKRRRVYVLRVSSEDGKTALGYTRNLSKSGMFITTMKPRNAGEEFVISFDLPNSGEHITCKCQVIRVIPPGSRIDAGMGVKFLDIPTEAQKKIEDWVKKG